MKVADVEAFLDQRECQLFAVGCDAIEKTGIILKQTQFFKGFDSLPVPLTMEVSKV